LPVYAPTSATLTIGNASTAAAFTGTAFVTTDPTTNALSYAVGVGDVLVVSGVGRMEVESVTDATHLVLAAPWPAATQTAISVSGSPGWYIIRNSVPAYGYTAKAIQDVLAIGSDGSPDMSRTVDDGTARAKVRMTGSQVQLAVGPTGTADGALKVALQIDPATGIVSWPNGFKEYIMGRRNRLLNGAFRIAQGGTTFTITNGLLVYTLDQWLITNVTGVTITVSRIAAPAGFRGRSALNITATGVPAGGYVDITHRVEADAVYDCDGKDCTYSFDLNASTTAGTLSGATYAQANSAADNGTFSSLIMPVSGFTFTSGVTSTGKIVPFPAANTVGLKNGAQIALRFTQNTSAGNISISLGYPQFERGTVANDFELPGLNERQACQWYFESSYADGVAPGTAFTGGGDGYNYAHAVAAFGQSITYQTRKRTVPTITTYDQAGTANKCSYYNGSTFVGGGSIGSYATPHLVYFQANIAGAASTNFQFTTNARL
jgi:hypothetical protein